VRYPLLQRSMILCVRRRGVEPRPSPLRRQRGYSPVGHPGIEPGDTAVSERPLQPAGPCPRRGRWRCRASRPAKAATGVQSPLPRRRRTFHRGTRRSRPPTALAASRFRGGARPWRVLVPDAALRPGVNRPETEEDGVFETHPEGPPGFRPGPAAWLVRLPRRAGDSNTTALAAQSLAATPGPLSGSLSVSTVPGIRTPTARCLGPAPLPIGLGRRVTDRIRTGAASLASSRAEPLTLRSHGADDGTRPRGACPGN
jgi:hypothetical protein